MGYFDLYSADEVFVTGTAAEVAPIVTIDGRTIGSGRPGPVTRQLMAAFKTATEREGTPISNLRDGLRRRSTHNLFLSRTRNS